MDNNHISEMVESIISVQQTAYKAGYAVGYQKGLIDAMENLSKGTVERVEKDPSNDH